jgi:hypothetical protein
MPKLNPAQSGVRNEENCETGSGVVGVPVVVEPVPVQHNLIAVVVEVRDAEVAIAVPHEMYKVPSMSPPFEYTLGVVSYPAP